MIAPARGRHKWFIGGALLLMTAAIAVSGAEPGPQISVVERQILAALPTEPPVAGTQWTVQGEVGFVQDAVLKRGAYDVLSNEGLELCSVAAFSDAYAVEALVSFPQMFDGGQGTATLQCGLAERGGKTSSTCSLFLACWDRCAFTARLSVGPEVAGTIENGPPKPSVTDVRFSEQFPDESISPLWPPQLRTEARRAMRGLPTVNVQWRRLRIEVRPQALRAFHNGFLVGEHRNPGRVSGRVMLGLPALARLGSLEVHRLDAEEGPYVLVPLDSACNAEGPVDLSSLPPSGQMALVGTVPFVLPGGIAQVDHVDIGASTFRFGTAWGLGSPDARWPSPSVLDPARIMLRVPRYAYRRAWIIAASDGEPDSTPILTLRLFRPGKGWPLDSAVRAPQFKDETGPEGARRILVKMRDGTPGSLWLLPVDIDPFWLASDFREEPALNVELTKELKDFRAFPDPGEYGSFQAGLPSAVRLYGLTLEKAPVSVIASSDRAGSVYTDPERPTWVVEITSQTGRDCAAGVAVEVTDPYGALSTCSGAVDVPRSGRGRLEFQLEMQGYGLHRVKTTVACEGSVQSRESTVLLLPPDRRRASGRTSRWGLWCWNGAHSTNPNPHDNLRLLWALGARTGGGQSYEERKKWGIGPNAQMLYSGTPRFALEDAYDAGEYARFSEELGKEAAKRRQQIPDLEYVAVSGEWGVARRVGSGPTAAAFTPPWYTDEDRQGIHSRSVAVKSAFEGVREQAPGVKCLLDPCPLLLGVLFVREGFPKELVDGLGLTVPQFERMPERPPRADEPALMYSLRQELKGGGYEAPELVQAGSYSAPSHSLALGERGQADSVVRTAVLSLALGTTRLLSCWALQDCEDYLGNTRYGCAGMIGRRPECNPKPATAAFATMTQMLDMADYDGWLRTGSRSAYCVRFKAPDRLVYCLWTVRGSRPITLSASEGASLVMVDENANEFPLQLAGGRCEVKLSPTPAWVVARKGEVREAEVGPPAYTEAPGPDRVLLDDFEKADWTYSADPYPRFAQNHWDVLRLPGQMQSKRVQSAERRSKVWSVTLTQASQDKPLAGWYGVFAPPEPIEIPGKPRALGIYAGGNSGWGRIVYELVDAQGEVYLSCGARDGRNCDDTHSWSYFNFDGWRYLEFPLPGNSPGDGYRESGSAWWNHSDDGLVNLPLKLSRIIVEMPAHQIYVDELLPVENLTVELDDLVAVYDSPEMKTDEPVRLQWKPAPVAEAPRRGSVPLNSIGNLMEKGVGEPTEIVGLCPPEHYFDGTRVRVSIKAVEGAKEYQVWVSVYPDGRKAQLVVKTTSNETLAENLKPDLPLYLFVTYTDAADKASKPSAVWEVVLGDFLQPPTGSAD